MDEADRYAISKIESGHNYGIVNRSSGALGRYQVMPSNVPSWTQQALGKALTPSEFLADKDAQDKVFDTIYGGYVNKYGRDRAPTAWFAGEGGMNNQNASDGNNTVPQYQQAYRNYVSEYTGKPYDIANSVPQATAQVAPPSAPTQVAATPPRAQAQQPTAQQNPYLSLLQQVINPPAPQHMQAMMSPSPTTNNNSFSDDRVPQVQSLIQQIFSNRRLS